MTYEAEVAKEYLRDAFMNGTLDVTSSFESVRGFVQIFQGEMEALIAIDHCRFLTPTEAKKLVALAAPTRAEAREMATHYRAWLARI